MSLLFVGGDEDAISLLYAADGKGVTQAARETRHAYIVAVATAAAVLWSWKRPLLNRS